ncbi:sodium/potassium/calcium exchanger 1, partial [Striga asiatica]
MWIIKWSNLLTLILWQSLKGAKTLRDCTHMLVAGVSFYFQHKSLWQRINSILEGSLFVEERSENIEVANGNEFEKEIDEEDGDEAFDDKFDDILFDKNVDSEPDGEVGCEDEDEVEAEEGEVEDEAEVEEGEDQIVDEAAESMAKKGGVEADGWVSGESEESDDDIFDWEYDMKAEKVNDKIIMIMWIFILSGWMVRVKVLRNVSMM